MSEDWTSRFFEECQDIGDEQMQQLWARIMAGEVARPGSFSPKTLSVVRDLTKADADLFTKLCAFAWFIPGAGFQPVIKDANAPYVQAAGVNFSGLMHLTSIGLVEFDPIAGYGLSEPVAEVAPSYCGTVHQLKSENRQNREMGFGLVMFTAVGLELVRISGAQGNDEIRKGTLEAWNTEGWKEEIASLSPVLGQESSPTHQADKSDSQ